MTGPHSQHILRKQQTIRNPRKSDREIELPELRHLVIDAHNNRVVAAFAVGTQAAVFRQRLCELSAGNDSRYPRWELPPGQGLGIAGQGDNPPPEGQAAATAPLQ